ncbi:MAG: ribonuclease III [Pseudomonadota bacterium]
MEKTRGLESGLGYQFNDPQHLRLALTHRSVGRDNNERLEFLGDSIVNHIIAEALYQRFPRASEGDMSRMRARLVKGETLAAVARELCLGDHLKLGQGERRSGGHRRESILADALEAVAGAVLLDGGYPQCREVLLRLFAGRLDALVPGDLDKDAKTQLQERLQGRGLARPSYRLVSVSGEEHQQHFVVACDLEAPRLSCSGEGSSRKRAEQAAAMSVLTELQALDS